MLRTFFEAEVNRPEKCETSVGEAEVKSFSKIEKSCTPQMSKIIRERSMKCEKRFRAPVCFKIHDEFEGVGGASESKKEVWEKKKSTCKIIRSSCKTERL